MAGAKNPNSGCIATSGYSAGLETISDSNGDGEVLEERNTSSYT
jgi:hypothetical protein